MSGASSYLLRLRLPDQPGVLGRVASALGSVGADIESIVVVDRAEGYAVDDLVVGLPAGSLADRLVSAVASVDGVVVETVQRHHGRRRVYDDLTLLDAASSSTAPLLALVDGLPELLQVSYALVVSASGANVRAEAASPGAPDAAMRAWLPVVTTDSVTPAQIWTDPEAAGPDCELLAAPFRGDSAILLGRMGGPSFLPAEITRVWHLSRLAQALLLEGGAA
jgi:ACT domain